MKRPNASPAPRPKVPTAPTLLQQRPPGADARLTHAQEQLLGELSPSNPLQSSIARDIVAIDGDLALLPKRRNTILWQSAITPMYGLIRRHAACDDDQARDLATTWAMGSEDAAAAIIAFGIDPAIAHNQAYIENILLIKEIEQQIERLERRRRHLLADYSRLNPETANGGQRSAGQIDDAEIISYTDGGLADVI